MLADLESKESGAFAGQAVAGKYGVKIATASNAQLLKELVKIYDCIDSDRGVKPGVIIYSDNAFVKGTATGRKLLVSDGPVTIAGPVGEYTDICTTVETGSYYTYKFISTSQDPSTTSPDQFHSGLIEEHLCSKLVIGKPVPGDPTKIVMKRCDSSKIITTVPAVIEYSCKLFNDVTVQGTDLKKLQQYPLVVQNSIRCQYGCSNGACCPQGVCPQAQAGSAGPPPESVN